MAPNKQPSLETPSLHFPIEFWQKLRTFEIKQSSLVTPTSRRRANWRKIILLYTSCNFHDNFKFLSSLLLSINFSKPESFNKLRKVWDSGMVSISKVLSLLEWEPEFDHSTHWVKKKMLVIAAYIHNPSFEPVDTEGTQGKNRQIEIWGSLIRHSSLVSET